MVGRIALILVAAMLLELIGNVALDRWAGREYVSESDTRAVARRLEVADRIASAAPPEKRARLMSDLAIPGLKLNWVPRTVITDFADPLDRLAIFKRRLSQAAPTLAGRNLRLTILPSEQPGRRDLVGALALTDGSFVTFRLSPYLAAPPGLWFTVVTHLLFTGAVLLIALLMIRALVRPLSDLAAAADATRLGTSGAVLVRGPHEVRRVASAFATMQTRLLHTVEDHTQSLIAVSHDLRTPIQRLRLRAALIDNPEMRDNITGDLIEMERFIDSTLAYIRDDRQETARLTDVAALVGTAVDNASDAGADIVFRGRDELPAVTRPTTLKRILANLIDNAVRHADRVEVTLDKAPGGFVIAIDDDGPGIPEARRTEAMLPFRRLQDARGSAGGAAGLGLATSNKAVAALGGTLMLEDSRLGGLHVRITLPAPNDADAARLV
jgi:signal transduction histidine kinase